MKNNITVTCFIVYNNCYAAKGSNNRISDM